jgi:hypothetical protein
MAEAKTVFYAVDRIEGRMAVLVGDDGRSLEFLRRDLPKKAREGSLLRVRVSQGGVPDFRAAVVDDVERKRRIAEAKGTQDELQATDPGGDVAL